MCKGGSGLVAARGWRMETGRRQLRDVGSLSGARTAVLRLTVGMVAQLCESTGRHRAVHFKRADCMVCKLQLAKAVKE